MVNGKQAFCANDSKSVLGDEMLETIARVSLVIGWNFVFGLKKGHLENEMSTGLENSKEFRDRFFGIYHMFQNSDAEDRVEVVVCDWKHVKRRINLNVRAVVTWPREVLIDELTIDQMSNFPRASPGV